MIYSFDPGHDRVGYAGLDPITMEHKIHGVLPRDHKHLSYFLKDLARLGTGFEGWPFPCTIALIEGQFIKRASTRNLQSAIAASTLKVKTVAAEIETMMTWLGADCYSVHPKTWQTVFKAKGWTFPQTSREVKALSRKLAAEVLGEQFTQAAFKQDVADAVCIAEWYKLLGKDKIK